MDGPCLFKILKDITVKNYVILFYLIFPLYMFVVYVCAHTSGECAYSCKDVWSTEVPVRSLPLWLSTLLFEVGGLLFNLEPKLARTDVQFLEQYWCQYMGYTCVPPCLGFHVTAGN